VLGVVAHEQRARYQRCAVPRAEQELPPALAVDVRREEAARAEWDRLARRAPELFQGRSPLITRLDRGEGQPPLFRLRAGGLPDQEAAGQFCEQVRARGGACVPVRG